jgi:S-adenosylmethionine:diacylglycerol 3-amino-3-carboxypropyl transferase
MTVGKAVSTEDEFEVLAGLEDDDDSSMESEAMAPGVGANVAGMFVGGCCFFFIKSL